MSEMSIGRVFAWLAAQDDGAVAVRDSRSMLTRGELDRRSNQVARAVIALGVGRDDVVTLGLPSTCDFVVVCAAVWKAGATPQPLAPGIDRAELAVILELAQPALVIGFDDLELAPRQASLSELQRSADDADDGPLPDLWAQSWKAPVSGGSTGSPKIVMSAAPARIDPSRPTVAYIPHRATQLVPAPLHHSAPFLFAMRGLLIGHELVLMERFDPAEALELIGRFGVTWLVTSPAVLQQIWRLDASSRDKANMSTLQAILHVGSACPQWLKRAWIEWLGPDRIIEIYAGTESVGVTIIEGSEWLEHPGSVGRPAPGTQLRILDDAGRVVAAGTVGHVHLRPRGGPGSTYRYLGAQAERVDGFESLGDLGWVDGDGYLFLADRAADVIRTGSGDVYPSRVEAVLDAHPAVRSSVVFGVDATVRAVVDIAGADVSADELLDWARERLEPAEAPVTIDLAREPLRNEAGKARRAELARQRVSP